jgi:hypothetical protein
VEFPTKFKGTWRRYLVSHCFCSLDEFYSMNWQHVQFVTHIIVLFFIHVS